MLAQEVIDVLVDETDTHPDDDDIDPDEGDELDRREPKVTEETLGSFHLTQFYKIPTIVKLAKRQVCTETIGE